MKVQHIFIGLVLLSACTTQNKKSDHATDNNPFHNEEKSAVNDLNTTHKNPMSKKPRYIGISGYFNRPPVYADESSNQNFQRCLPLIINSILEKDGTIFVYAKQNNNIIIFSGINRHNFKFAKGNRLPLLEKYFVKNLDIIGNPRIPASMNNKVCQGQTWSGMAKKEFLFLYGDPEKRQTQKTNQGSFDVWSYLSNSNEYRHYYFREHHLYSWTQ